MKSIIVIPTYNEIENIEHLINEVLTKVDGIHVLVVDDNSPDGTAAQVKKMMASDDRIHLLERPGKMGLGTAYCDGFRYALARDYEAVFEMDADFSHDPNELPRFLEALEDNDLVIGSRYIKGVNVINWPLSRLILSYGAHMYSRVITGMPIMDATGGFKCFRASKLREIDLNSVKTNGYGFQIEMKFIAWKLGYKIVEIPIIFTDRKLGASKMSGGIFNEALWGVLKMKLRSMFSKYQRS